MKPDSSHNGFFESFRHAADGIRAAAAGEPAPAPATPEALREFHDGLFADYRAELFGPSPVLGRMKELWGYLYERFSDGEAHLRRIQRSATLGDFGRNAAAAFDAADRAGALLPLASRLPCGAAEAAP